jgi:hypothetical protein
MRRAIARAVVLVGLCLSGAAFAGDEPGAKSASSWEWRAPFADMSPEGMALIGSAMKRERIPANAEEVRKARGRVLELLAADRLDVDAIRRAQAAERAVAIREHALQQEKLLKAYQQLSLADRRAFVAGLRAQEERMLKHMQRARERMIQVQERIRRDREQFRRDMDRMQREVERVKKETGWMLVPPAPAPVVPPAPLAPPAAPEAQVGKG